MGGIRYGEGDDNNNYNDNDTDTDKARVLLPTHSTNVHTLDSTTSPIACRSVTTCCRRTNI